MILYDYPKAPNPMRVNLFINEKNIKIKRVFIDLSIHENLNPKFLKLNPWGTVPFLRVNNQIICESIAICRYLDCKKLTPKLFGSSPMEIAKIEMFRRKVEFDGLQAVGEAFRNSSNAFKDRAFAGPIKIPAIDALVQRGIKRTILFFNFLENNLKNKKYVAGNKFSIADIEAYTVLTFAKWIKINGKENRKNIIAWSKNLEKRKSFKNYFDLVS
ncbi:glutathione S-transferase [Alphaproteobacteria bacterium]|nr:glutathione S-transferase [Alphaproteobacteria bacterium]